MSDDRMTGEMVDGILGARRSRRWLLKRASVLGLSIPAMSALLAACGGDDDDDDDGGDTATEPPAAEPTEPADEPTEAEAGETEAGGDATEAEGEETEAEAGETEAEADETEEGAAQPPAGEGNYGGRLVVANAGQPTSFDIHQPAGGRTPQLIGWHMFETLFTWDGEYAIQPQLAESYEASDDATVHTITLRQGVPFHNGQEMTAADVVASLNRWAELSPLGELLYGSLEELVEVDDYTIELRTTPIATVPQLLARGGQGAAIYPASVIEASGTDFIQEYIGTGPYQFTEFQADRFTLLTRFEDYVGPTGEQSGYAGVRMAYLDELEFRPVPDEAARVAGFQAGDYHYLEELVADQIEQMRNDPNLVVDLLPPRSYGYIGLNHANGVFTDLRIRQAAQAAMNVEPQGLASHGEGYFELGPGIMLPVTVWGDSEAGAELYNQNDPEKARQLLEEAGYDGTPVRWLTTQDDLGDYNSAVVCQQQLEEAGFTVELTVLDEATLATTRNQMDGWDAWNGAFILRTDPTLLPYLSSCDYSGFWCSPEKEEAFERLLTSIEFEDRYAAFEDLQRLFYEEVGGIKQQDNYGIMAVAAVVQNFGPETTHFELEPEFTNCWLENA